MEFSVCRHLPYNILILFLFFVLFSSAHHYSYDFISPSTASLPFFLVVIEQQQLHRVKWISASYWIGWNHENNYVCSFHPLIWNGNWILLCVTEKQLQKLIFMNIIILTGKIHPLFEGIDPAKMFDGFQTESWMYFIWEL